MRRTLPPDENARMRPARARSWSPDPRNPAADAHSQTTTVPAESLFDDESTVQSQQPRSSQFTAHMNSEYGELLNAAVPRFKGQDGNDGTRLRRFSFTCWAHRESTEAEQIAELKQCIVFNPAKMRYLIYQIERAPDTRYLHAQGYIELLTSTRLSAVKWLFNGPHFQRVVHLEMSR